MSKNLEIFLALYVAFLLFSFLLLTQRTRSVGRRSRERSGRKADTPASGVEDGVEALEEGHAVDEVEALARRGANRADDEEDFIRVAADSRVQSALEGTCESVRSLR